MPDPTDLKILSLLSSDARLSARAISSKLGLSTATVIKRTTNLEKQGFIKGYSALIDYDALGYQMQVIIQVRVAHGKEEFIEKKLMKENAITAVYDVTGDFDLLIIARFKSRQSLNNYVKRLQTFEFVERTQTLLILNTFK